MQDLLFSGLNQPEFSQDWADKCRQCCLGLQLHQLLFFRLPTAPRALWLKWLMSSVFQQQQPDLQSNGYHSAGAHCQLRAPRAVLGFACGHQQSPLQRETRATLLHLSRWGVPNVKHLPKIRQQVRNRRKQTVGRRFPAMFLIIDQHQWFEFLADMPKVALSWLQVVAQVTHMCLRVSG